MSRPKPTPEDDDAREARIERYGRADADFSDAELADLHRRLTAKFDEWDKRDREYRRLQKAGLPRWPGDSGERRS